MIKEFGIDSTVNFALFRSPGYRDELTQVHLNLQLQSIPVRYVSCALGILLPPDPTPCSAYSSHGDMLYLQERKDGLGSEFTDLGKKNGLKEVEEDEVDKLLSKMDGRVVRQKDSQL